MKKITLILSFCIFCLTSLSQEKEDLYLKVNNNDFWPANLGYNAVFSIKSEDERFSHDNYLFKISYHNIDYQSLYSIGKPINIR